MAKKTINVPSPSGSKLMDKPAKPVNNPLDDTLLDGEAFVQRNRTVLISVVAVLVVGAAAWFGYSYYRQTRNTEAQQLMFPSVFAFEADSLNKALKGDGINEGLLTIADDYGMTNAGNLADFYVGVAYMKEGKFDNAINYLKDFKSSDLLVQARAYALLGDAYLEKGNAAEAITYYQKAADYQPNAQFTPQYLAKLALAQEVAKNNQAAIATYDKIINTYPESAEATTAKKYKSKLEGLVSK